MQYEDARHRFIQAWGTLGSNWGINRTMAQIHALLLISEKPLSTEQIMEDLSISRGNANMNLRALIDWGIVFKELIPGERKEYFRSDKDVWALARHIARERKKRELEPIQHILNQIKEVEGKPGAELDEFKQVTEDLRDFAGKASGILDTFIISDNKWWLKLIKGS